MFYLSEMQTMFISDDYMSPGLIQDYEFWITAIKLARFRYFHLANIVIFDSP